MSPSPFAVTAAAVLAPAVLAPAAVAGLARAGYLAVFLGVLAESAGVPVPGEAAVLAAAFAAARGAVALPWVVAVAAAAALVGDLLAFALGRRHGRAWLERHGRRVRATPERVVQAERLVARYGAPALLAARFVAGLRVTAAFLAGAGRMRWPAFAATSLLGATLWAAAVGGVGWALGRGYARVGAGLGRAGLVLGLLVPGALLAAWLLGRVADGDVARPLRRGWLSGAAAGWAAVLGVGAAAVATFAMLADEVGEGHTTGFDAAVRAWTQARRSEALVPAFVAVTRAGSMYVTGPVGVLVALWLWRARGARVAAAAVATPVAALSTIGALKVLFFRARPPGALADPGLAHALNYSFPSGHSAGSMAIATTLAYVLARERLAPRWAVALAVAFALLVGVSRVYLDVHWPTDVIGGWAVGLAFAAGGVALYERLRHAARHAERAARAGAPGEAPPARADVAA